MIGAPGGDVPHGEGLAGDDDQELGEGPGGGADLHPGFQGFAGLLPEVVDAPPALEVVEQRLDIPLKMPL